MNCKVTVLVAVYNMARFLPTCLDSLLGQTLKDLQVVCVDDASTDGSLSLLRRYSSRDSRIEVIALAENHGQAYARNEGLKRARGEYVCFLDSDDWFSPDALEQAVGVFEANPATDTVLFQVDIVPDTSSPDSHPSAEATRYQLPPFVSLTGEEAFRLSLDWQIHGVNIVRTPLHRRFPYDGTCRSYSDDNTTRLHYKYSREVRQCQGVYYYRQHLSSTSHVVSVHQFDRLKANESMKKMLMDEGVSPDILQEWEITRMLVLVDCYMFYHVNGRKLSAAERRYGLDEMRRVWSGLDRSLLTSPRLRKFGYRPMPSWWLFRLQEWAYFTLRGLLGKNREN